MEEDIAKVKGEKEAAIKAQDFELAASLRDKEKQERDRLDAILTEWREKHTKREVTVGEPEIVEIVAKWSGVPLQRMEEKESQKLLRVEEELRKRVVGQDEACTAIAKALRRSRADIKDPKRPIGSFVFLGPTGVGKTLLAKALAEFMFGDENALLQFDMSEYMEKFNVSRLVGSPPGYVGYEEGGQLTERVRRRPYSVILFDEIEKAHPDVSHILLQIMEDGRLTDSLGRTVDFRNTIVIMTSNIGADLIKRGTTIGFTPADEGYTYEKMKERLMEEAKRLFKPEFMNRLDDLVVFRQLTRDDMIKIVEIEANKIISRMKFKEIEVVLTKEAKEFLIEKGYDPNYGARPLRRAVERYLEDPLAEEILRGTVKPSETIEVSVKDGKLTFTQKQEVAPSGAS
jgi:ATP-dependent Clp protease ATP-binding subunit ClpC